MKKILLSIIVLLMGTWATAQDSVIVTFAVDLSNEMTIADTVLVTGSFQSASSDSCNGDFSLCLLMQDSSANNPGGDSIYTYTLTVAQGMYEYVFLNGSGFGDGAREDQGLSTDCAVVNGFGEFNRTLDLSAATGDTVVGPFIWNSCDLSMGTVTSVVREEVVSFQVAPNPATSMIRVSADKLAGSDVFMTSMTGQMVRNFSDVKSNSLEITRGDLPAGIYMITVRNAQGTLNTQKVVLQ